MSVLITGGGGLIGSAISRLISQSGNITCVARNTPAIQKNIRFLEADLLSPAAVNIIEQEKPRVIIHCAATIPSAGKSDDQIYQDNAAIDAHVLKACKETGAALIYFSSTIVYGYGDNDLNIDEGKPPLIISSYAKQKLESEALIQAAIPQHAIFRINAPYGTSMKQRSVMTIFADKAIRHEDLSYHGNGERMQDFTHVDDVARLIQTMLQNEVFATGIFNISAGEPITMKSLAGLIVSQVKDCRSKITPSGQPDAQEGYKASYNIEKAKKYLGWTPSITIQQGIHELIQNRQQL